MTSSLLVLQVITLRNREIMKITRRKPMGILIKYSLLRWKRRKRKKAMKTQLKKITVVIQVTQSQR